MAENLQGDAAVVTDSTCGICLEDSRDPLNLPCGHSFCDGCLGEWRSRYGVKEEMRTKCPICRARIPPSKEMVATLLSYRAKKQVLEDENNTSSQYYRTVCRLLVESEQKVGADWDGVTVLEDNDQPAVEVPNYIGRALVEGDPKPILKWINANRTEDRVNSISGTKVLSVPALSIACIYGHLALVTLLLQLGADVDLRIGNGHSAIGLALGSTECGTGDSNQIARLLLSWGACFFPDDGCSKEDIVFAIRENGKHELANLVESELGGRRCEVTNLASRSDLNGKTCVADEYLPDSNKYRVTLETKSKEALIIGPDNLKRRDRTPRDCGYYIEFKNGRTIRHDFDSSEDCQAFVAARNRDESGPVVSEEAEARAEQAAAELLAELGLGDSPNESSSGDKAKKSKKKKGGRKKKK